MGKGFSGVSGQEDVVFADNASFDGTNRGGIMTTNGELWIGSTAARHVKKGTITSPLGTLSIGYSSPNITIDITGGSAAVEHLTGNSGGQLNPTLNNFNIFGASVAAGTSPVTTVGAVSTITVNVQTSQALAAADATKIGLSNFDSSAFAVAATGFVTLSTTGVLRTLTGDTGTATPVAGNIQIAGGPGVTTSATGAVVTINSVVFTDTAAATLAVDNGYFATAAGTYPLPATALQGEMLIVVCDTAGAVVLDAPALNFIRVGSLITSSGGTITSTSIGDSVTLRYRLSSLTWEATSIIGTWLVA